MAGRRLKQLIDKRLRGSREMGRIARVDVERIVEEEVARIKWKRVQHTVKINGFRKNLSEFDRQSDEWRKADELRDEIRNNPRCSRCWGFLMNYEVSVGICKTCQMELLIQSVDPDDLHLAAHRRNKSMESVGPNEGLADETQESMERYKSYVSDMSDMLLLQISTYEEARVKLTEKIDRLRKDLREMYKK